ncbi:CHAD domain-containing protein [Horticoccus sp. 23ND18S-11]|uniref:CHAD domain-containing protein n=1 Tax=Horticoccus sp. 23ND18S-11 TaxID=3391832 RepID=UPI0039C921BE
MKSNRLRPPPAPGAAGRFARFTALVAAAAGDGERLLKACRHQRGRRHVHALRVASRRLQAYLQLASAVLPAAPRRAARRALADVLEALGRFRDATVQRALAGALVPDLEAAGELDRLLARRERRQRRAAVAALKRLRLRGSLQAAVAALGARVGRAGIDRRLDQGLRRVLLRDWERMVERWPREAADTAAFHRARVALKRYRYAVEALPAVLGRRHGLGMATLKQRQRQLGELHDDELLLARVTTWVARGKLPPSLWHALQPVVARRIARLRRACLAGPPAFVASGGI